MITGPWNHSFIALMQTRECVLAVPTIDIAEAVIRIGGCSGMVCPPISSPIALMADVFLGCAFESLAFHHSEIGAMFVADFLITGVAAKDSAKTKQKLEELEKVVGEFEANIIKS